MLSGGVGAEHEMTSHVFQSASIGHSHKDHFKGDTVATWLASSGIKRVVFLLLESPSPCGTGGSKSICAIQVLCWAGHDDKIGGTHACVMIRTSASSSSWRRWRGFVDRPGS